MKKLITILLFTAMLQGATAQEIKISHFEVTYFKNTSSFELSDQLPNGIYKVYYDSLKTILDYYGEINNYKRVNTWTWYYENGMKKREINYQNGVLHGQVISYFPDGQQSVVKFFNLGVQNGVTTSWFSNGTKKFEGDFANGNPSGVWKFWKPDGSLFKEEQH